MELFLDTYHSGAESTGGLLYVDSEFCCFTCEDQPQETKVPDETRIPAGRYEIKLRTEGGMSARYGKIYPFHEGMLHLQDVPGFEWIYIHVGNTDDNTSGCILVGLSATIRDGEIIVGSSVRAYMRLYRKLLRAFSANESIWITVRRDSDEET